MSPHDTTVAELRYRFSRRDEDDFDVLGEQLVALYDDADD